MISTELSKIEKQILIRAPRERVWRAITTLEEFCKWFGVQASGKFEPGARIRMVSTHEKCAGIVIDVEVQQMEHGRRFSWLWHPGAVRPEVDYSQEPKTTVVFELEDADGGTLMKVTESGFDQVSLVRRASVFEDNTKGWEIQMASLDRYVASSSAV